MTVRRRHVIIAKLLAPFSLLQKPISVHKASNVTGGDVTRPHVCVRKEMGFAVSFFLVNH